MGVRDRFAAREDSQSSVTGQTPADSPSARELVRHRVRTTAGPVSLSWDSEGGVFVAERGQETWTSSRLGDLARTVGLSIPAKVARELRRDERLHPGPRTERPAYDPQPSVQPPATTIEPPAPADHAVAPAWPPAGAYVVPSRQGQLAVAWDREMRSFAAVAATEDRWQADHLDDLAIKVGARIPRAYVENLLRDAGRPLPVWHLPSPETSKDSTEWRAAPVRVPALLDSLPPGVADELRPAVTVGSPHEAGGIARVETARRAVRAEWGAWVHEAPARRELIENLGSVMQGLARGELLHEAVRRLEGLADRFSRQLKVERSPTLGAVARAHKRAMPTVATRAPVDRLHALRSRSAPSAEAVGRS